MDTKSKLIDKYEVTSAEVRDSQSIEKLIEEKDREQELHADSAYIGEPIDKILKKKEVISKIIERSFNPTCYFFPSNYHKTVPSGRCQDFQRHDFQSITVSWFSKSHL